MSQGNHLHGRRGCSFDAAWWDGSWRVGFVFDVAMWVRAMRVMSWKPPSCWHGGRSTRPWWDVLRSGDARQVGVRWHGFCFGNHTRAGSVPDRRGRCGINWACQGLVRRVALRSVKASWGVKRPGKTGCVVDRLVVETKLVKARCRINAGGLGWTLVRCGWFCLGVSCHVRPRLVMECYGLATNRHRGRRGEASTPRGGMHYGMVRRVEFGPVPVW